MGDTSFITMGESGASRQRGSLVSGMDHSRADQSIFHSAAAYQGSQPQSVSGTHTQTSRESVSSTFDCPAMAAQLAFDETCARDSIDAEEHQRFLQGIADLAAEQYNALLVTRLLLQDETDGEADDGLVENV